MSDMLEKYALDIARVAARVRSLSATCPFGFWFITDIHVPDNHGASGPLLAHLVEKTGLRTVVCGGDIPGAFGSRADLDAAVAGFREGWTNLIERAGGDILPLHGNHDFTIRSSPSSQDGYTYPAELTRHLVLDTAAVRSRCVCDPSSCAFFADFPVAGIRFIAIDTHDSVTHERPFWGVMDGISAPQLDWLRSLALGTLPEDWRVVVASHAPLAGVAAEDPEKAAFAQAAALLDPLARKGRVLAAVSGHHHCEMQSCVAGIWHITEPCDAAYLDYINHSKPWCPDLPEKKAGTWAGQTFAAVQIDSAHGLAHFTRVGGGSDRTLRLAPIRLRVGETLPLTAQTLDGTAEWGAYDADRATSRPNPERLYDRFVDYYRTVADIAPDGTLRAIAPGEATAVARATDGTREYIPVVVTGT